MNAETTLRRAADMIREDYCAAETDNGEDDPFMFAVADWLDHQAHYAETTGSGYHGGQSHGSRALAVANAYLQETP